MELFTLCVVVIVIAVFVFCFESSEKRRIRELVDKIPGDRRLPLLGTLLRFLLVKKEDRFDEACRLHQQYQPLDRTWLGQIPIVSMLIPQYAEIILNNRRLSRKSDVYKFLRPWMGTGLLTSSGSKWQRHRKAITPTFHFSILETFIEVFSEKSQILVKTLDKEIGGKGFDICPYISNCALDIICETAMGTPVQAQTTENSAYVTAVHRMTKSLTERMARPELHPEVLFRLSSHGRTQEKCLRTLREFVNKVVSERKEMRQRSEHRKEGAQEGDIGRKKRVAFLDMLLDANEAGETLTDEEIREEVHTFMFEGHDTVSTAMSWAIFLLGLNTDIQHKAFEELEDIFRGSDRSPTMRDLQEMKYIERIIKETLRLYPSVPAIGRKAEQDMQIGDYNVPKGVELDVSIHFIHKNPEQFPNPEVFDPDNFLPERVIKRHPYAFIPFSAGPRNCIGQRFAMLEMKTVLSYLLRYFRFLSLDRREDIKRPFEMVMHPIGGIRVIVSSRN